MLAIAVVLFKLLLGIPLDGTAAGFRLRNFIVVFYGIRIFPTNKFEYSKRGKFASIKNTKSHLI